MVSAFCIPPAYPFVQRSFTLFIFSTIIILLQIDFEIFGGQAVPKIYSSQDDWDDSLNIILEWSPFSSMEKLLQQVL